MSEKVVDNANSEKPADGTTSDNGNMDGFVKYETYDKVIGKLKKTESNYRDLASEFNALKSEIKAKEEQKLLEEGNHVELLGQKDVLIKELNDKVNSVTEKNNQLYNSILRSQKEQAVAEKLAGKIKKSEYFEYINVDDVVIDPDTGNIDVESAQLVANKFAEQYPELIETKNNPRLPGDAANFSYQQKDLKTVPIAELRREAAAQARLVLKKL